MPHNPGSFLIFGGAGLVGTAICREIVANLNPQRMVVCSLQEHEAVDACERLRSLAPSVEWVPEWGNLFVSKDLAQMRRGELMSNPEHRASLLSDLFDDFRTAYDRSSIVDLIRRHRPEVIVDSVNTATGISYQDIFEGATVLRENKGEDEEQEQRDLEEFMLSSAIPQIIRHTRLIHTAAVEVGSKVYIKIGTTGTGGMGFNIPYTHSEDRPSSKLMAKTAVAFAHTGLLFLMARTPGPIVKEIKPAAMIGYKAVEFREIPGWGGAPSTRLYRPEQVELEAGLRLNTRADKEGFRDSGETLKVPVVNTGENGLFALGEFAAITALSQMEFVTPEEIARDVVAEIRGANTGHDVIAALDSSVLDPSYRAGFLREVAIQDLEALVEESGSPSVALGKLGPPELSKLLFEAHLLSSRWHGSDLDSFIARRDGSPVSAQALAHAVADDIVDSDAVRVAISIGVPVLLPDGRTLLRGPRISVPEIRGKDKSFLLSSDEDIDRWASKGWVDLRPANIARWQQRFREMLAARVVLREQGSAGVNRATYLHKGLHVGDVVAWVFKNELDGFRIK